MVAMDDYGGKLWRPTVILMEIKIKMYKETTWQIMANYGGL